MRSLFCKQNYLFLAFYLTGVMGICWSIFGSKASESAKETDTEVVLPQEKSPAYEAIERGQIEARPAEFWSKE